MEDHQDGQAARVHEQRLRPVLIEPKEKANDGVLFLPSATCGAGTDMAGPDSSHRGTEKGWEATDTSRNKGNYHQTLKKKS